MHALILTLFPEMFPGPLGVSLAGKALEKGIWSLEAMNIRDFGIQKPSPYAPTGASGDTPTPKMRFRLSGLKAACHPKPAGRRVVDDSPYGGGTGMVMRADVVGRAIEAAQKKRPNARLVCLTPRGTPLTQPLVETLKEQDLILICGRFEGIDDRVMQHYKPLEISIGDYVLSGGEIAAMALLDACIRLLPGVIGKESALHQESFAPVEDSARLLEYPQYTRPPLWMGLAVPDVLTNGHHGEIENWRRAQAEKATRERRPDLWEKN